MSRPEIRLMQELLQAPRFTGELPFAGRFVDQVRDAHHSPGRFAGSIGSRSDGATANVAVG
jgi:hypothetical protein